MTFLRNISIILIIPFFLALYILALIIKNFYFDLPSALELEKELSTQRLYLIASSLQSNFSNYLQRGDQASIQKELTLLRVDRSHYEFAIILGESLETLYSYKQTVSKKDILELAHEIPYHDLRKYQENRNMLVEYDAHQKHEHFDVAIPLFSRPTNQLDIRNSISPILYIHYSINKELNLIKKQNLRSFMTDLIFTLILFLFIFTFIYFFFIKKLKTLASLANNFTKEDYTLRSSIEGFKEVTTLSTAFNHMVKTIQNDFTTIQKQNHELLLFKRVVEQSPIMVMITDPSDSIEYVNPALLKTYGYALDEVLNHSPRIFSSGVQSQEFYEVFWDHLLYKDLWTGQMVNKSKDGTIIIEEMKAFPIKTDEGVVTNYIGIKNDITLILEQQKVMTFQTKLAQMGEMISMIAHQWRQPLSAISAISATNMMKIQLDKMDEETLLGSFQDIENITSHLSSTIEDFRNFFKPEKHKSETSFAVVIDRTLKLIEHSVKDLNITYDIDLDTTPFQSYEGELMQVLLNLIKNSADIFKEQKHPHAKIEIRVIKDAHSISLIYSDNAGGTKVTPIEKLFEPYFTTKDELQGTGLGLYMSNIIIKDHCEGDLKVRNIPDGIEFTLSLPL